jgi:integrase/recombinase XerC
MRDSIEDFRTHLASRNAPRTAKTYGAIAASFLASLGRRTPEEPPTRRDVEAFLARPRVDGGRRSAAGRNQELQALRALGKFALRECLWPADPTTGVPFLREAPRDPAVLSLDELRRLFIVAAETAGPRRRARDMAALALLSQVGLRVHELVRLDLDQIDLASATLIAVKGKGGTVHDLPLNVPTVALLSSWIGERGDRASEGEPALFISSRGRRLGIRSVQRLLVRLRGALGTPKKITPHALRHSCATLALTLGTDLSTVAELLRHSDLNTTRRYLHLVDERRREAVRRLAVAVPPGLFAVPVASQTNAPAAGSPDRASPVTSNVTPLRAEPKGPLDVHDDMDDISKAA